MSVTTAQAPARTAHRYQLDSGLGHLTPADRAAGGASAQKIEPALGTAFPRTHHVLMLEFWNRKDFDNPRREWRRLFSELPGTFALVLVAAGGGFCMPVARR